MPYGDPGGYGRPILPGMVNQPPGYSIGPLPGTPGYVPEGLERMTGAFDPMASPLQKHRGRGRGKKKGRGYQAGDVQSFLAQLAMMQQGQNQGF